MSQRPALILVPIEPLAERYTEQWYNHMPQIFAENYDVKVIDGSPLQTTVKVGAFLDANSTVHYKCSQLMTIAKMFNDGKIEDGTRFFFGDLEYWGIESVVMMARLNGVRIRMTGFLHAASHTKGDAMEVMADIQRYTEVGWLAACERVYVGSEYAKEAFVHRRLKPLGREDLADRIVVTGNPMFASAYQDFSDTPKKKQVVLSNRLDREKNIDQTLDLFEAAHAAHPDWNFVVVSGRQHIPLAYASRVEQLQQTIGLDVRVNSTKAAYHKTLAESMVMVSNSPEESFGYCIAEAALYDCQPLLADNASHPEMVCGERRYLFNPGDQHHALANLEHLMENPKSVRGLATRFFTEPMNLIKSDLL